MRRVVDVLALMFAAGLASLYLTGQMLDGDEAIFAAVAERMRVFDLPVYEAGWDHKPPGIFLVYRWLLPLGPAGSLIGPHVGVAVTWVATAALLGLAARRLFGKDAFAPAVVIYALLRSYGEAKAGAANTEAFLQVPLVVAGFALLAPSSSPRRNALLGGGFLAVAALLKPPAALFGVGAVAAVLLLRGKRHAWTTAWGGALGAAVVFGVEALRVLIQGDGTGWWACNVVANQAYVEHGPGHTVGDLLGGLGREMVRVAAPWVLALVGATAAWTGCVGHRPDTEDATSPALGPRVVVAGLALLATGLHLVTMGGHFFRHYWMLVHPVLTLFAAAGCVALLRRRDGATWRTWLARGALVAAVVFLWLPAQRTDKRRLLKTLDADPYRAAEVDVAATAIREMTAPDDTVFVWGIQPELHLYAERTPATRMITCAFLSGTLRHDVRMGEHPPVPDLIPGAWDALMADLEAYRPALIVDTAPGGRAGYDRIPARSMPRLAAYLDAHYEPAGRHGVVDIYRRRD